MEKTQHFPDKTAKYVLGIHRGTFPSDSTDGNNLAAIDHVETADTITLGKIQRIPTQNLCRHWKRFWCCYAFGAIVVLAIFWPIFFLVCIPAISQNVVNEASLELLEAQIMQPRPSSMVLSLKSAIKVPINIPVQIQSFTLDLFNRGMPGNNTWAKAYVPPTTVKGSAIIEINKQLTPLAVNQWTSFVHSAVFMAHSPLSVYGTTDSFLGKLKSHVVMDKDVQQNTLNQFKGLSIKDPMLLLPPHNGGINLIANVMLPNPSVMTLEIGTIIFELKSGSAVIGNATIDNLVLKPGNHSNPIHGIIDLRAIISNLGPVLRSQAGALNEGHLNMTTVAKSIVYDGTEVPYYTEVMKSLSLTAQVSVKELIINTLRRALDHVKTSPFQGLKTPELDSGDGLGSLLDRLRDSNVV